MKKSKFTEEQIVRILRKVKAGAKVVETCRKHGISGVWKNKYTGMEVPQLQHLKDVDVELARLKRMYADLAAEALRAEGCPLAKRLNRRSDWS